MTTRRKASADGVGGKASSQLRERARTLCAPISCTRSSGGSYSSPPRSRRSPGTEKRALATFNDGTRVARASEISQRCIQMARGAHLNRISAAFRLHVLVS
eukprot:3951284-Pleurochrysis_carterae.AAC.1